MKQFICIMLAVMLALSAVFAFAAEYTDKDTVKRVQQALNDAGYNCGTPDGSAGKKTKQAIQDYRSANGLTATGMIDDELLAALGLAEATAEAGEGYTFQGIPWGSSPEDVKEMLVENGLIDARTNIRSDWGSPMFSYYPKDLEKMSNNQEIIDFAACLAHNYEFEYGTSFSITLLKSIGGFGAEETRLDFMYAVEDGEITSNPEFIRVGMYLGKDEAIFDTLSKGLADKYGKYTEKSASGNTVHLWQGPDQTVIGLVRATNDDTHLIYAKRDSYDRLQQMKAITEAQKTPLEDAGL